MKSSRREFLFVINFARLIFEDTIVSFNDNVGKPLLNLSCFGFRTYQTDIDESIKSCGALLEDPDIEIAVRVGDIYAFLTNHFTAAQNYNQVSLTYDRFFLFCYFLFFIVIFFVNLGILFSRALVQIKSLN